MAFSQTLEISQLHGKTHVQCIEMITNYRSTTSSLDLIYNVMYASLHLQIPS